MHDIRLIECQEQPTVGVRQVVRTDDLPALFDWAVPAVADALQRTGTHPAGPPYARYRGRMRGGFDVEVGFPVPEPARLTDLEIEARPGSEPVADALPAVRAAETVHDGTYDDLSDTYARLETWVEEHDLQPLNESWEFYESGPASDPDPGTWRTRILMAVTGPAVEAH